MVLGTIAMTAQNSVGISDFSITVGETKTISIELNNSEPFSAFQMDLMLPDGISIADVNGIKGIALDESRKDASHSLAFNEISGGVRLVAYSLDNAVFSGNSGSLVKIALKADENKGAMKSINIKNILFSKPNAKEVNFADATAVVAVSDFFAAAVNYGAGGYAMLTKTQLNFGESLTLYVIPKDGYKLASLLLNGEKVEVKDNIYNVASAEQNMTFDVSFNESVADTVEVIKTVTDTLVVTDTLEVIKTVVDTVEVIKTVTDTVEVIKTVTDTVEVIKTVTDTLVVTDTLEVIKTVVDTVEVIKTVTDTLVVTDTVEVIKTITDTIEIETIEVDTIFIAEVTDVPAPEVSFADGKMSIECALQGADIYYTLDGTVPTTASQKYTAPVEIKEDCTVMAIAVVGSETTIFNIVGTGLGAVSDEIVSRRYFTEAGVEIDEPVNGINIVIIKYASGKTETKKVVVRKK